MSSNTTSPSGGVGVLGLLGVVFVTLKLTGFIDWSWWYVTMPFWGGFALIIVIGVVVVIGWIIKRVLDNTGRGDFS